MRSCSCSIPFCVTAVEKLSHQLQPTTFANLLPKASQNTGSNVPDQYRMTVGEARASRTPNLAHKFSRALAHKLMETKSQKTMADLIHALQIPEANVQRLLDEKIELHEVHF